MREREGEREREGGRGKGRERERKREGEGKGEGREKHVTSAHTEAIKTDKAVMSESILGAESRAPASAPTSDMCIATTVT